MTDCNILAVVISIAGFRHPVVANGEIQVGDWVRLVKETRELGTTKAYRTDIMGTWGRLGKHYRPIINLETGALL